MLLKPSRIIEDNYLDNFIKNDSYHEINKEQTTKNILVVPNLMKGHVNYNPVRAQLLNWINFIWKIP